MNILFILLALSVIILIYESFRVKKETLNSKYYKAFKNIKNEHVEEDVNQRPR